MSKQALALVLSLGATTLLTFGCSNGPLDPEASFEDHDVQPNPSEIGSNDYVNNADLSGYFPLQEGNKWIYAITTGGSEEGYDNRAETFTVEVSDSQLIDGRPVFTMANYMFPVSDAAPAFRNAAPGHTLEISNGDAGVWYPWSRFGIVEAPIHLPEFGDDCVHGSNGMYLGLATVTVPAGTFERSARIVYDDPACSDLGIASEVLAPGVGLIERTTVSWVGETTWSLVYAEVNGRIWGETVPAR